MLYFSVKTLLSAILIVAISEAAKRWTLGGALLAALPVTSILAMIWLYLDTGQTNLVSSLSINIFWMVLPSLLFFVSLPWFLKLGWSFSFSLASSIALTAFSYFAFLQIIRLLGIRI